jgi:hypothetical protein
MSHARCNIAARTTLAKLKEAALSVYAEVQPTDEPAQTLVDFDAVLDFCQPRTEEIGGPPGSDAWYFQGIGPWSLLGDLGLLLHRRQDALKALSEKLGTEVVVCVIDAATEYAYFGVYAGGQMKRLLVLEDGEYEALGLPVQAERGRAVVDFSEEEAERLWTSYGLPTFEYNPEKGPFEGLALKRKS